MNKKELYHEVVMVSLIIGVAIGAVLFGLFMRAHIIYVWLKKYYGGKWECLKKRLRLNST